MNDTDQAILLSLIHRTRKRLWGRRLLQSLWYGCCVGAILLFLLAMVHILFIPIPVSVWLPCLTLPGLLMALKTALRQRPTCAETAMELDRAGAHEDLLVSAWEMLSTVHDKRPAGAGPVLQRANEVCTRIDLPGVFTTSSPWRGRFSSFPWIVMILALFLLQMSTPGFRSQLSDQSGSRYGKVDGREMRQITTDNLHSEPSNREAARSDSRQPGPAAAHETTADNMSGKQDMAKIDGSADAVAEQEPTGKLPPGNNTSDGVHDLEEPGIALPPKPATSPATDKAVTRFEDISRMASATPSRANGTIGNADFTEQRTSSRDAQLVQPMTSAGSLQGVTHNNLFSLSQRLQIQAYFDSLEETP